MAKIFPEPIGALPEADIPLAGVTAYLSQADTHQIIFMEFERDADLPAHSHAGLGPFCRQKRGTLSIDHG